MVMIGQAHCRQGACVGAHTERRVLIDLSPLWRSRDLRCLVLGELGSVLGTQLTTVAVPYQVCLACIAGALLLARLLPGFRKQRTPPVQERATSLSDGRFVEVAGIEPASFSASPGLLRAQLALLFSAPAITQARRRQAQPLFDVPPGPAAGSGGDPSS